MPYTLAKWALWLIAAAVIGFVIGWLLRGLRRGRSGDVTAHEHAELVQLREQVAELGQIADDHERLQIELDDCRERSATARAVAVGVVAAHAVAEEDAALELAAERDRLAALVTSQEATIGDLRARLWNQDARLVELQDSLAAHNAASAPPPPDLEAAAAVLGEKVRHNDLTVIDGIGPKIADLLQREGGIKTWWDLHLTDVATLRALLETGGPRFQVHDPSSWPEQAGLLARGEWQQFQTLVARLQGGKLGG